MGWRVWRREERWGRERSVGPVCNQRREKTSTSPTDRGKMEERERETERERVVKAS